MTRGNARSRAAAGLVVLLWLVAIAAAVWLRIWHIHTQILIDDEWHALHRLMRAGYRDIFLSFGHADYSIPLTLLFNALADTIGLSELRMRFLPLVFGIATVFVVPMALRPWLRGRERAALALLLAISPLLVHFSRVARPYALVVPMAFVAVVALWRWWHERRPEWLWLYAPLTVASAWLHPLTLMFTLGAASWFGLDALRRGLTGGGWRDLGKIVAVGGGTLAACAALLLPPLLADPHAMTAKSGVHRLEPQTLLHGWEFFIGTTQPWVVAAVTALALYGGRLLGARDRDFLVHWIYLFVLALGAIVILEPAWIRHGQVLARYTVTGMPLVLALVAIAVVALARTTIARLRPARVVAVPLAVLAFGGGLYMAGPFPWLYDGVNQFTNSVRYHFRYDLRAEVNPYTEVMNKVVVHDFYDEIAQADGEWEVVESPWWFETHFSPLTEYQDHHQRRVRIGMMSGLCTDWTWGEVQADHPGHIRLRNFVFLKDLLDGPGPVNRFVVFHRESPFAKPREIPDIEPCIDAFRQRYGEPWREIDAAVVFRLPAGDA